MTGLPSYTEKWHNDVYPQIDAKRPELSMKGKRVVITGGAGGIGAATARAFAVAGAGQVFLLGRTLTTLEAARMSLQKAYSKTTFSILQADVADSASLQPAFDEIARSGPIDIFINNAGFLADVGPIHSADVTDWWKAFEINVRGSFHAIQNVLKNINPNGVVINVTSGVAHIPYVAGHSAYAVSKMGSTKLFEYLQQEHPELRIYNLQPGIIESTEIASKAAAQSGMSWPQQDTLELPANFMVWLSSPIADFLKGRFVWANWDVEELGRKTLEIQNDPSLLTTGLNGV